MVVFQNILPEIVYEMVHRHILSIFLRQQNGNVLSAASRAVGSHREPVKVQDAPSKR
jgi:hypothetical protein